MVNVFGKMYEYTGYILCRYKKQMDEMQRVFNETTARIAKSTRKAEENEEKQQGMIEYAERRTTELENEVK